METICVQRREGAIKAKKLRRLGFIPANVFGKSLPDPISIQLKESDARRLLHQKREGSKLMLDLEGTGLPVQIKEKEIDTIKGQIQHISFQALTADEKVNSVIHILLVNDDKIPGQLDKMSPELEADIKKFLSDRKIKQIDLMKKHNISRNTLKKYIACIADK